MKRKDGEHNVKTFGNVVIGIHEKELPKFAENPNLREYWKYREDHYNENPRYESLQKYKQSIKHWAKPEELLLADTKDKLPPPDPLKLFVQLPNKKTECPLKVNDVPYETLASANVVLHPLKVPSVFNTPKYKSVYDCDLQYLPPFIRYHNKPLYSSFSPNCIFTEPYPFLRVNKYLLLYVV